MIKHNNASMRLAGHELCNQTFLTELLKELHSFIVMDYKFLFLKH